MTYRVEVTAPTIHELSGKLAALASQLKGLPGTFDVLRVEAAEMPRAAKAQPAPAPEPELAEPEPAPAPEPEPAPAPEPEHAEIEPARTYDYATEVAPHVLGLVNKRGRDAAKAVLAQFDVTTASKLDPARYGELMSAVDAALEEK
jgi:hypothetical protein